MVGDPNRKTGWRFGGRRRGLSVRVYQGSGRGPGGNGLTERVNVVGVDGETKDVWVT